MRLIQFLIVVVLVLTLASCARSPEKREETPVIEGATVKPVVKSTVDEFYVASGAVRARTRSVIAARIMGNVVALHVREGDRVRVGQTLVELENRDAVIQQQKARSAIVEAQSALDEVQRNIRAAQSGVDAARANEKLAQATFKRYETLHARRSVSTQEFEEARARSEVASAEAERAERILEASRAKSNQVQARIEQAKAEVANTNVYAGYARLRSPIAGVVVAKHVDSGSLATPGTPLLTIESISGYQLEVAVEESQVGRISLADSALVQIEALQIPEISGSVSEIVPATDANSRSYIVRIDLPDAVAVQMRSGLYGKARFITAQRQAVLVPSKAVVTRGQLTSVFVVDAAGVTKLRLIEIGKAFNENIEVLSGLNEGERIVVEGLANVTDGGRISTPIAAAETGLATR